MIAVYNPQELEEMKSSAVTIVKDREQLVDLDYLKTAIKTYPNCVGIAVKDGKTWAVVRHKDVEQDADQFQEVLEGLRGDLVIINLQDNVEFEQDIGPFTLLENSNGEPILLAFLDGDFSDYASDETSHSPASYAAAAMKARIQKIYSHNNGDLDKTIKEIDDDEFLHKDFQKMMTGNRGTITLAAATAPGDENVPYVMHISVKNDSTKTDVDFGWTSNTLEEPAQEEVKQPEAPSETPKEKTNSAMAKLGKLFGGSKSDVKPAGSPQPSVRSQQNSTPVVSSKGQNTGDTKSQSGTKTNVPGVAVGEGVKYSEASVEKDPILIVRVPSNFRNDGKRMKWFQHRVPTGGPIPSDWKTATTMSCNRSSATKDFMETWMAQNKDGLKQIAQAVAPKTETAPAPQVSAPQATERAQKNSAIAKLAQKSPVTPTPKIDEKKVEAKVEKGYPEKNTETKHVAQDKVNVGVVSEPIAIVPPTERKTILDILNQTNFKEAANRQGQLMSDPKKFSELEDQVPPISEQLKLGGLEETKNWPYEYILEMAKKAPTAVAVLAVNWRAQALKTEHMLDEITRPDGEGPAKEEEQKEVKPTAQPQQSKKSALDVLGRRKVA